MSLCINPNCDRAKNQVDQEQQLFCSACGSSLLLNDIYRVLRYLGGGGFGWTYLVDDGGTRKVLKMLHNTEPKAVSLFDQEAEVLQQLHHPGIPRVDKGGRFNYLPKGSPKPLPCLVMEYIEGENLADYLEKRDFQPISEQAAIRWLRELVEILDLVHGAKYFHRDIKPPNIMIRNTGKLALIDFGTAREETTTYLQKQQGKRGTVITSVGYTPHEQANGRAEYRSDFFALGRTFVFLLTGKEPEHFEESLKKGLQWQQEAQGYSQEFRDLIDYLMCPDVEDRPINTQVILQRIVILEPVYQPAFFLSPTPSLAEDYYNIGISEHNLGDYQGAIADFSQAIEINPNFADAYNNRGFSKHNLGDYQGAIADYNQAIKLNSGYAYAYHNRGFSKHNLGDYQGAIADYNQAIKINPDLADSYNNRGFSKHNLGDYQGAITDYNQAIKLNPDLADFYNNRGLSKHNLRDYQGAITDFNQALKLNPHYANAYFCRGNSKDELGDYQGAITDYNQGIKLNPDDPNAYHNRGLSKDKLGDYEGAIADYNQAIKLNPDNATAYYCRGFSKHNLGDYQGAIADYNQAIKLNPNFADVYCGRGFFKLNLGDYQGAIQDFCQAAKLFQQQNDQTMYQNCLELLKELGVSP